MCLYVIVKYFMAIPVDQSKYVHISYSKWWHLLNLKNLTVIT